MGHPSHPVISSPTEARSVSEARINTAFQTVKTAAKAADFTADITEASHYLCDATTGAITVTLPDPALATEDEELRFHFKKVDVSINAVTLDPVGSVTIDGETTKAIGSQWASLTIYADKTSWYIEDV